MPTLVINAPWRKKDGNGNRIGLPGQSHSWETYFKTGIALGYVLFDSQVARLRSTPSGVVLLRTRGNHQGNIIQRRAEACLVDLQDTQRPAGNGGRRYNVFFKDQVEVPYAYLPNETLSWNGVRVI
jgi:hypothetical protein